jgi:two-component system, sensor histidine kinase PdtaS
MFVNKLHLYIISLLCVPHGLFGQDQDDQVGSDHLPTEVSLLDLCEKAFELELYESALDYAKQAKADLDDNAGFREKGDVSFWMGKCNLSAAHYESAETDFVLAIHYYGMCDDTLMLAKCYNDLGRTYKKISRFPDALKSFNRALNYFMLVRDFRGVAQVYLNVGNVLKSIGRDDQAKIEYRKALGIFKSEGDLYNEAGVYNNLGNIYKNQKNYDSAFHYMYKTLHIREQDSAQKVKAYIYHNLANLHLAVNNTDSALYYSGKSLAINESIPSRSDMAYDYNVHGSVSMVLGNYQQAIGYFEKALELSNTEGAVENRMDVLRQLGYCYFKVDNFKKSAETLITYLGLDDSMNLENNSALIETEMIHYELFADSIRTRHLMLEKDLEQSRIENMELTDHISRRNFYYAFVILFLVLITIVTLLLSARRRLMQTREHQAILQVQNDELKRTLISKEEKEVLLKEVHHRVKNNLQIINSLIRLQSNFMTANNYREKLVETENRIRSMALIHEKLYKTGNLASLSIRNYIEELSFNIIELYENHNVKIKLRFDLEEREYGIDTLIPIGLIINEALSNSMKYAFFDRDEGNVWISIRSDAKTSMMLIKDDGLGADLGLNELKEDSLGIELILSLADQLDGRVSLDTENGFEYIFEFPRLK